MIAFICPSAAGLKSQGKFFFFEKKKQKTLVHLPWRWGNTLILNK